MIAMRSLRKVASAHMSEVAGRPGACPPGTIQQRCSPTMSQTSFPAEASPRSPLGLRFALLVPTCNPGASWAGFLQALAAQTLQPDRVVFLDSESSDGSLELSRAAGYPVWPVRQRDFNHGGTRQLGVDTFARDMDVVVFMTQDALLASPDALVQLLQGFASPEVAAVWGRQLPGPQANPLAAHARLFNYPDSSRTVRLQDRAQLGLRTCFLSNSFAAYRVPQLQAVGGFSSGLILGEDMHLAARLLQAGNAIRYQAEACVYHFHNYTWRQDLARSFDIGVFHASQPWLLEVFGAATGEGLRFVRSELRHLWRHAPARVADAVVRTALKLAGYHLGRRHHSLPPAVRHRLSMHKGYWA